MKYYKTDISRIGIYAEDGREAAEIAALRLARRNYGRNARVGALNCDSWASDGSMATYQAFVGRKTGLHETTGHNVWFNLYAP